MEHLKLNNDVCPNNELNKSTAPQRLQAYVANKTQLVVMKKLNSGSAYFKRLIMETAHRITRSAVASIPEEVPLKKNIKNYIGIDMASETFTTSIFHSPQDEKITQEPLSNSIEGFQSLCAWFKTKKIVPNNSIICMEATGVYGEAITHYLASQGFSVAVEPPLKVKRAFDKDGHKTDAVDSAQIAEYAYRFFDELRFWKPTSEIIEKLKHFLTARELLVKQSVSIQNALKAYERHIAQDKDLLAIQKKNLSQVKEHLDEIDQHIDQLIRQNPTLHQMARCLDSLSGVGLLLAAYMLVTTNGFQNITDYRQYAAFLGICPYKFESGKSVHRKSHSRYFGPSYTRKLLHLAARSVATHQIEFRKYYYRKIEEGKSKTLVLNNIANKLLKISFALVRDRQCYIKGYRSVSPLVLQNA